MFVWKLLTRRSCFSISQDGGKNRIGSQVSSRDFH